jgi:hypothetical protein
MERFKLNSEAAKAGLGADDGDINVPALLRSD